MLTLLVSLKVWKCLLSARWLCVWFFLSNISNKCLLDLISLQNDQNNKSDVTKSILALLGDEETSTVAFDWSHSVYSRNKNTQKFCYKTLILDIAKRSMLKQMISRAYFIYSYFGIRSIEHALREPWQVFLRKHDIEVRIGINVSQFGCLYTRLLSKT